MFMLYLQCVSLIALLSLTQFVFSIAGVNETNSNYSIGGADYIFACDF